MMGRVEGYRFTGMRYVELLDGSVILAPRRAVGHMDMVRACGRMKSDVASAGFVSLGNRMEDAPEVYGQSVGLGVNAKAGLQIPVRLFGAKAGRMVLFASNQELLEGLVEVEEARWGVTEPSPWGDVMPVFAPLHTGARLHAGDYISE